MKCLLFYRIFKNSILFLPSFLEYLVCCCIFTRYFRKTWYLVEVLPTFFLKLSIFWELVMYLPHVLINLVHFYRIFQNIQETLESFGFLKRNPAYRIFLVKNTVVPNASFVRFRSWSLPILYFFHHWHCMFYLHVWFLNCSKINRLTVVLYVL